MFQMKKLMKKMTKTKDKKSRSEMPYAEHEVQPEYRKYLTNPQKAVNVPYAPYGLAMGRDPDEWNARRGGYRPKTKPKLLPIQGPANWSQIWRNYEDIGDDYAMKIPKGQPLLEHELQYLRQSDEEYRDIDFVRPLGKGAFGEVWLITAMANKQQQRLTLACKVISLKKPRSSKPQSSKSKSSGSESSSSETSGSESSESESSDDSLSSNGNLQLKVEEVLSDMQHLSHLKHPNICNAIDIIGIPDRRTGFPFARTLVLMELCDGDLDQILKQASNRSGISESICLNWFRQMAVGLKYSHSEGVAHLDLKPANVLYVRTGNDLSLIKLADFGLSYGFLKGDPMVMPVTSIGTTGYMAPELTRSEDYDVRADLCDVYSLGMTFAEVLMGRKNWWTATGKKHSVKRAFSAISRRQSPPEGTPVFQSISSSMAKLVFSMIRTNPSNRCTLDYVLKYLNI